MENMWWEGVEEDSRKNTVVCEQGSELGLLAYTVTKGRLG